MATALKPWKTRLGMVEPEPQLALQCGHGVEAVEDVSAADTVTVRLSLQCGHGVEAVEDATIPRVAAELALLQCGHGVEAVEDIWLANEPAYAGFASMWPRR